VPGALRAVKTCASFRNEFGIVFGERRRGELQKDVVLDPLLKVANREQDAFCLVAVAVLLLIAGVEGFELLLRLEFGQQESMSDADLVFSKGFDDFGGKTERIATSLLTFSMSMKTASFSRAASPGPADSAWLFSGFSLKAQSR
jgi:hypothetical protein